jgi:metal-responsive CopG/Arc/MetJ family transcriptional regulator
MTKNISVTVSEQNLQYLDSQIKNRSKYINELIEKDRRNKFESSMRAGYIAQSENQEIQAEERLWEVALSDGLEDED